MEINDVDFDSFSCGKEDTVGVEYVASNLESVFGDWSCKKSDVSLSVPVKA